MSWLKRERSGIKTTAKTERPEVPEGSGRSATFAARRCSRRCSSSTCGRPHCDHHFRVPARQYVGISPTKAASSAPREPRGGDPLGSATPRCATPTAWRRRSATRAKDAAISGVATIGGVPVSVALMNFFFMGGSMGSVVGEKSRARSRTASPSAARSSWCPPPAAPVCRKASSRSCRWPRRRSCSLASRGGGCLFVSLLTDPSTAGVLASYASLGDVIVARPKRSSASPARVIRGRRSARTCPGLPARRVRARKGLRGSDRPPQDRTRSAVLGYFWHSTRGFAPTAGRRRTPTTRTLPVRILQRTRRREHLHTSSRPATDSSAGAKLVSTARAELLAALGEPARVRFPSTWRARTARVGVRADRARAARRGRAHGTVHVAAPRGLPRAHRVNGACAPRTRSPRASRIEALPGKRAHVLRVATALGFLTFEVAGRDRRRRGRPRGRLDDERDRARRVRDH